MCVDGYWIYKWVKLIEERSRFPVIVVWGPLRLDWSKINDLSSNFDRKILIAYLKVHFSPHCDHTGFNISTIHLNIVTIAMQTKWFQNRKCQGCIMLEESTKVKKRKHYLKHENKVNENKVLSYCEAWRYLMNQMR